MTRNPTRFLLTVSALLMKLFRPNKQRRRRKYQSLSLTFEASQIETLELRRMFSSISVGGSEHLGQNIPNTASSSDPTQSVPVVSLSEVGGTYNGLPYVPTVTVVSDLGRAVSGSVTITYFPGTTADGQGSVAAPSAAGTYTAVADFVSHDPNFGNAQSAPLTYTISKAIPHMQVTAPSGTYSAVPFTAKAKVLGFTGFLIPGSTTITYYAGTTISGTGTNSPPTDAGTYSVVASFISRNPNFADIQSSSSTFVIRKATPKVQAIDPSGNFNGNPFTATSRT